MATSMATASTDTAVRVFRCITFAAARLQWSRRTEEPHAAILDWHARLLELRRDRPALQKPFQLETLAQVITATLKAATV